MLYKGLYVEPYKGKMKEPARRGRYKRISVDVPYGLWEDIADEARAARCSVNEIIRAITRNWLETNGTQLTERGYAAELGRAKYFMQCEDDSFKNAFWRGYAFGLHRGHDEGFDDDKHEARYNDESGLGAGYRAGIYAYMTGIPFKDTEGESDET